MNTRHLASGRTGQFCRFGLIVTGKTEEGCLPEFFRSIAATGRCSFKVIRRIDQLSPIRSDRRRLQMVGSGKAIPTKDAELGLSARQFLSSDTRYLVLVDDLEAERSKFVGQVFDRYRLALNTMLDGSQRRRVSVQFLVNMLEAYFFADIETVNRVLGTNLEEHEGDVEEVRNPKAELKRQYPGYDEKADGTRIVGTLNIPHVLSRKETCASLRTMFAWICRAIGEPKGEVYQLRDGRYFDVTRSQICALPPIEAEASN